jgi:hypothetical protein
VVSVSTGNSALDIGLLDGGTLTASALNVTAGNMTTGSPLSFSGVMNLNPLGTLTITNAVSSTGALTVNAGGAITGAGGIGSGGNLTLNASSVGSVATPLMLGTVSGWLNGTVTGGLPTDIYNVKSLAAGTINLGVITAIGPVVGIPVTIDATGGSIRHVHLGTDITGGRVNFWAATIGTLGFDLEVITDNPPVMCNGVACDLPYFVNGATATYNNLLLANALSQSGRYLLGASPEEGTLLTAGVLPDQIYRCLNQKYEPVVCMADAVWGEDEGAESVLLAQAASPNTPRTMRPPAQRTSAPGTTSTVRSR